MAVVIVLCIHRLSFTNRFKLWGCFVLITGSSAFSALTLLVGRQEMHLACKNRVVECWHDYLSAARCRLAYTAQLMPLPLTASCFSKIQMSLPFWYRLTRVVPDKGLLNGCMYWQQCMVNKHEHICRSLLRQSSNSHRDSVSEHRHKRRLAPSPDRERFVCLYLSVYASRSSTV